MKIEKKKKTSIAIDAELRRWVEKKIKEKKFASFNHAVEYALQELMKKDP